MSWIPFAASAWASAVALAAAFARVAGAAEEVANRALAARHARARACPDPEPNPERPTAVA